MRFEHAARPCGGGGGRRTLPAGFGILGLALRVATRRAAWNCSTIPFGDSSINVIIRFWIDYRRDTDSLSPRSEAIKRIQKAVDANDITILFPIRTLDFGVVGGVNLGDVLSDDGSSDLDKRVASMTLRRALRRMPDRL